MMTKNTTQKIRRLHSAGRLEVKALIVPPGGDYYFLFTETMGAETIYADTGRHPSEDVALSFGRIFLSRLLGVEWNAPELSSLLKSTIDIPMDGPGKYDRVINHRDGFVDVYDVLVAFEVTCPALQHAIKKCLAPGQRGTKSREQDIEEAIVSLERALKL